MNWQTELDSSLSWILTRTFLGSLMAFSIGNDSAKAKPRLGQKFAAYCIPFRLIVVTASKSWQKPWVQPIGKIIRKFLFA